MIVVARKRVPTFAFGIIGSIIMLYACCHSVKPAESRQVSAFDTLRALALAHRNGVR